MEAEKVNELRRIFNEKSQNIRGELKDFDWSLRYSVGSDELVAARQPLLVVRLTIEEPSGALSNRLIELTGPELEEFLKILEPAEQLAREFLSK
mmetsp:Transcript_41398/g.54428  ORF Transcript_41398/g.54428 Transcript_41398/m.54428 type:complete len:94 (+) Transcript_41398:50-331(+)